jgi:hypothetical protein
MSGRRVAATAPLNNLRQNGVRDGAMKKETIEIKIDRLKLMRIPIGPPGRPLENEKDKVKRLRKQKHKKKTEDAAGA